MRVIHHTLSLTAAAARDRSHAQATRAVASAIAVTDQSIAATGAAATPTCSRFHAIRQRAEQNRACSRRGVNAVPHCAHSRTSATYPWYVGGSAPHVRTDAAQT